MTVTVALEAALKACSWPTGADVSATSQVYTPVSLSSKLVSWKVRMPLALFPAVACKSMREAVKLRGVPSFFHE